MTGSDASVGDWARIEGTPNDPNPDKPFAKMESPGLFNQEGRLNPAVTILGEFCVFVSRYSRYQILGHCFKEHVVDKAKYFFIYYNYCMY